MLAELDIFNSGNGFWYAHKVKTLLLALLNLFFLHLSHAHASLLFSLICIRSSCLEPISWFYLRSCEKDKVYVCHTGLVLGFSFSIYFSLLFCCCLLYLQCEFVARYSSMPIEDFAFIVDRIFHFFSIVYFVLILFLICKPLFEHHHSSLTSAFFHFTSNTADSIK